MKTAKIKIEENQKVETEIVNKQSVIHVEVKAVTVTIVNHVKETDDQIKTDNYIEIKVAGTKDVIPVEVIVIDRHVKEKTNKTKNINLIEEQINGSYLQRTIKERVETKDDGSRQNIKSDETKNIKLRNIKMFR